mmetsp:Transcript_20831/g.28956  ORF Transcript_20831/g.28956 Transcript_20831/m.28956 type:complete len:89 (-) Transcript_20831:55-321(-)
MVFPFRASPSAGDSMGSSISYPDHSEQILVWFLKTKMVNQVWLFRSCFAVPVFSSQKEDFLLFNANHSKSCCGAAGGNDKWCQSRTLV